MTSLLRHAHVRAIFDVVRVVSCAMFLFVALMLKYILLNYVVVGGVIVKQTSVWVFVESILSLRCLCNDFYGISALVGCWFSVFLMCFLLITQRLWLVGRSGSRKPV